MSSFPIDKPAVSLETAKLTSEANKLQSSTWQVTGVDVSRWQKVIDWERSLSAGITFAFIKAAQGTHYIDTQFDRNMRETARLGIPRGIYHFFKPDKDWKQQADHFASVINSWDFELEPVIDLEVDGGLNKSQLESVVFKFIRRVEETTGREIMIYTSPGFYDSHLPLTNWAWRKPLWVANWIKASAPRLPREWSNHNKPWTFWQYSSDKNGLGSHYGVATKNIDLNRFNGTREQFMQRYNLASLPSHTTPPIPVPPPEPPPPPSPVPPSPVSGPLSFLVLPPALHIRSGPGIKYPIIRDLHAGDIIQALDISAPREVWIKIGDDQWCAMSYNGYQFMRKVHS